MTDKEKREFKDGVISIFKRFNILDHTATIGGLRDDILRYIDSMKEEPVIVDAPPYDYVKGFSDGRLYEKRQKEEPVSEKKCMYSKDNYTDEERKVLCEDCDHRCAYGVQNIGDYDHKVVIDAMMADVEEKSKAEDRRKEILQAALDYANNLDDVKPTDCFSRNLCIALGQAFIKGAEWADSHQAEKDLELGWKDIPEIFRISEQLKTSWWFRDNEQTKLIGTQVFWEEVLKRFKENRK